MTSIRPFLLAALLLGLCSTGFTASGPTSPQLRTYAVLGFFTGAKPPPDLVEQAAREIGLKMQGAVQTANVEEADQVVQVVFRQGGYRIYVDALPFSLAASFPITRRLDLEHSVATALAFADNRAIDSSRRGK
jgi:hypothetical protein